MIDFVEISEFLCYKGKHLIEFNPHAKFNAIVGKSGGGKSVLLSALAYVLGDADVLDLEAQASVLVKFTEDEPLFKRGFPDLYSIAGCEVEKKEYLRYIQEKATVLHFNLGLQFLKRFRDPLSIRSFIDTFLVKSGYHIIEEYPFFNGNPEDESIAFEFETSHLESLNTTLKELKRDHSSIARNTTILQRKHALVEATSAGRRVPASIPLLMKQIFNLTLEEHAKLLDRLREQIEISDQAWDALDQYKKEKTGRKSSLDKRLQDLEMILEDAISKEDYFIKDARMNLLHIDLEKLGILDEYLQIPTDIILSVENDNVFDMRLRRGRLQNTLREYMGNLSYKQMVFRESIKQMEDSLFSLAQQISIYHSTVKANKVLLAKMNENLSYLKSQLEEHENVRVLTIARRPFCHAEDIIDEFRKMDPYCEGLVTDLLVFAPENELIIYTVLREYTETPIVFTDHKMIQYCSTMFRNSEYCETDLTILCTTLMPYAYDTEIPDTLAAKFPGICWVSSMVSSRTKPLTVVVKNSVKQHYYMADTHQAHELAKLTGLPVVDKGGKIHRLSRNFIIADPKSEAKSTKSRMNETEDKIRAENVRISILEEEIMSMELDIEFLWRCSGRVIDAIANLSESYSESILECSKSISFLRESFLRAPHVGTSVSYTLCRSSLPKMEKLLNTPVVTVDFTSFKENEEREIIESINVHGLEANLERDAIDRVIQERYLHALKLEEMEGRLTEIVYASTANIVFLWQTMSTEDRAECTKHEGSHDSFEHFLPFVGITLDNPHNLYYLKTKLRYEQERNELAGKITVDKDALFLESSQRQIEENINEKKRIDSQIRTITKQLSAASSRLESIKEAKVMRCQKILEKVAPLFKLAYRELNPRKYSGSVPTVDMDIYERDDHIGVTWKVSSDKKILLSITELSEGEFMLFGAALQIALAMLCNNSVLLLDEFESSLDKGAAKNLFEVLKDMVHSSGYNYWLLCITQKSNTYSLADQLIGVRKETEVTSLSIKSFI